MNKKMNREARMQQTREFYERYCDGSLPEFGAFPSLVPLVGPNGGTDWDFCCHEEIDGFQMVTLSSDRQSTILICDNSHRWWEYVSITLEIPWNLLNADEDLLERQKQRLVAECKERFAWHFPDEAAEGEAA